MGSPAPTPPGYRRRRSFAGPVVLIVIGIVFLLGNIGFVPWWRLGQLFAHFWPALIIAPLICGLIGAAIEMWGLRRVHRNGHIAELLFTFGLALLIEKGVQMTWGLLPVPYRVPELLDFPLFRVYGTQFPAYRAFMLLISALMFGAIWLGLTRTRVGLVIQAALTHPDMASALGHNVPRIFTLVFAAGTALAGLAGVIGGNYQVTEPAMAFTMGPIVFVVVVFGGLGSLTGCFIASILMGLIQTFAVVFDVSLADLLAKFGFTVTSSTPFAELLTVTLPRVGALLPFLMMVLILVFRPRGLMGTRDT